MDGGWARDRFATERVARLATVDGQGRPLLVPIVFAVAGDVLYSAVDGKPKSTRQLRRLDNIAHNPQVSALVDRYSEDWDELWWARADGCARVIEIDAPEATAALIELTGRYPQYREQRPPGPVIAIDVAHWSGWTSRRGRPTHIATAS
ncbi:MAG: TIGR03668 family PPOX class F420-dependent oxidoreductase [Actinomycetota bacterium]